MTNPAIYPVVLCGGSGKRLWPLSRKSMPKQFVRLGDESTLLQNTLSRLRGIGSKAPILVTANDYRFMVAEQVHQIGIGNARIVLEPEGRNTGPAISAAAEIVFGEDPDALLLVCPADHMVSDPAALAAAISAAAPAAAGQIITFGIRPDRPETGFGYIELSDATAADGEPQPFCQFIEKPDRDVAKRMLETGRYVWNSGIFLASARTFRDAFDRHAPEITASVRAALAESATDLDFLRLGESYRAAPEISVDYAIMENEVGAVVPVTVGWNDLGNWRSVWESSHRDKNGVATTGTSLARGCSNTLLMSDDGAIQVVGIGLQNIAAIATRDAVLITSFDSSQVVSDVVTEMAWQGIPQAQAFRREFRPWGYYETLALGPRYQVKSIVVRPGGQLSLQSHVHRSEHWVVVEGTARVTIGKAEKLVSENESVYIPLSETHRLANPGRVELRLIEVQTGSYLMEDDIIRYEDAYDRV